MKKSGIALMLVLLVAACGQSTGPAPVINGQSGQTIYPGAAPSASAARTVTVEKGDSLYRIARRHKVDIRGLIDANGLKPPYTIFPGQKLQVPSSGVHIVRRGDTIYQIADRYGTEPGVLVRLNRISPPYRLSPGQQIVLPGSRVGTLSTVATAPRRIEKETPDRPPPGTVSKKPILPPEPAVPEKSPAPPRIVEPPRASSGGFIWPVSGRVVSRFGSIGKGLQNDGINILARKGTPVRAIQNGVVAYSGNELRGFGNLLLVKHAGGWISAYAHNSELLVRTGEQVRRGQVISRVGRSGSVDKPQLHFELRRGNRAVDPERYLGRRTASVQFPANRK